MVTDRRHRKSTSKRKNSNKSLVQDIRYRNIELMKSSTGKLRKSQRKTNTRQNENSLESLALCHIVFFNMSNLCLFILEQVLFL